MDRLKAIKLNKTRGEFISTVKESKLTQKETNPVLRMANGKQQFWKYKIL